MDMYDEAIAYFRANPEMIDTAWHSPGRNRYGCLFDFMTPSRKEDCRGDGQHCGCPSQVFDSCKLDGQLRMVGWTDDLTNVIARLDLPLTFSLMSSVGQARYLQVFAQAQRLADALLPDRLPPSIRTEVFCYDARHGQVSEVTEGSAADVGAAG